MFNTFYSKSQQFYVKSQANKIHKSSTRKIFYRKLISIKWPLYKRGKEFMMNHTWEVWRYVY